MIGTHAPLEKRQRRMDSIDKMDAATKAFIHEYGYPLYSNLMALGVTNKKKMRSVINTVLNHLSPTSPYYRGEQPNYVAITPGLTKALDEIANGYIEVDLDKNGLCPHGKPLDEHCAECLMDRAQQALNERALLLNGGRQAQKNRPQRSRPS